MKAATWSGSSFVSGGGERFPCGFEEVELVVQLALDENPVSTIDLRARQKLSTRVRVNAQEVELSRPVRAVGESRRYGQPERKREDKQKALDFCRYPIRTRRASKCA
jgi:hypothetical protein